MTLNNLELFIGNITRSFQEILKYGGNFTQEEAQKAAGDVADELKAIADNHDPEQSTTAGNTDNPHTHTSQPSTQTPVDESATDGTKSKDGTVYDTADEYNKDVNEVPDQIAADEGPQKGIQNA